MADDFFGGTTYKKFGLLNAGQEGLLGSMIQNYGSLGRQADTMQSVYQGAPEQYFQNAILNPLRNQYQDTLANLRHTGKRHSSFTGNMINNAGRTFLNSLGQVQSEFMNQERLREMSALNDLRAQQLGLYGAQNQVGGLALNRDTFENVAEQNTGVLGKISSILNLAGGVGGSIAGMASGKIV